MISDVTAPSFINATCVRCDGLPYRLFELADADTGKHVAVYRSSECGHEIHLDLDP